MDEHLLLLRVVGTALAHRRHSMDSLQVTSLALLELLVQSIHDGLQFSDLLVVFLLLDLILVNSLI